MHKCDMYIGNDTGMVHMAAAANLPTILISAEAEDKSKIHPGHLSSIARFRPWNLQTIILQPKKAIGACVDAVTHGGCTFTHPHCITQIKPKQIVQAYEDIVFNHCFENLQDNWYNAAFVDINDIKNEDQDRMKAFLIRRPNSNVKVMNDDNGNNDNDINENNV